MDMGNVEYKEDTFGDDALKRFDAGLGVGVEDKKNLQECLYFYDIPGNHTWQ